MRPDLVRSRHKASVGLRYLKIAIRDLIELQRCMYVACTSKYIFSTT